MIYTILGSNVRSDSRRDRWVGQLSAEFGVLQIGRIRNRLDSLAAPRVGFGAFGQSGPQTGGESVLVNGAVFKTVSETVRAGSGRFDSYTPPPG